MVVDRTGSVLVTETTVYDFGIEQRHGIFRNIPVRVHYDDRFDRVYPLEVLSVEGSPGTPAGYEEEEDSGTLRIKIGDPDRTISGRHVYTLRYRLEGALNSFPHLDELYWNAIGAEWQAPIAATVTVSAPAPLTQVACFSGPARSSLPCPLAEHQGARAVFGSSNLAPYQGLTVVAGLPKGTVPEPRPLLDERWSLARAFEVTRTTLAGSLALLAAGLGTVGALVWKSGRDRRQAGSAVEASLAGGTGHEEPMPLLADGAGPVEHQPPEGLRPGQVGTLVDEAANPLDATATIVDLAVRGYLRIEEIPKEGWFGKSDWNLTKLEQEKDKDEAGLRKYERLLLKGLFEDGDEVQLSDLRNDFAERLKKVEDALYEDAVAQGWFSVRPDRIRLKWTVIGVAALSLSSAVLAGLAVFTHFGLLGVPLVGTSLILLL